jgi:hypothetical protein
MYNVDQCEDCYHEDVCKLVDTFKEYVDKIMVYDVEDKEENFAITINIECKYFRS